MTDKNYSITVLATMSSGKSTVINALIGDDLLPAKNMACTAKITKIIDDDKEKQYIVKSYNKEKELLSTHKPVDRATLSELNESKEIDSLEITGNIPGIRNYRSKNISFIDTPGPNNSADKKHGEIFNQLLENYNHKLILYVLNSTQFGINDDLLVLNKISETLKNNKDSKYVFLLNKIDQIDEEIDGNIKDIVNSCSIYLNDLGIKNVPIIPISADAALLFKKVLKGHSLSRKQWLNFQNYYELFFNQKLNVNDLLNNKTLTSIQRTKKLKYKKRRYGGIKRFSFSKILIKEKQYKVQNLFIALKNTGVLYIEEYFDEIIKNHKN